MEKVTYQGKIIEVVEKDVDVGGSKKVFELARRSPGVRLIIPNGSGIIISKEFRSEHNKYDYRLPGGKVYDSLKEYNAALNSGIDITESAKAAAIKEAHEEVGLAVKEISFLHKSVCGATIVWDLFYFLVTKFESGKQHLEAGEDITFETIDREEVKKMCLDGRMSEERSALILLRYLNNQLKQ